MAQAAYVGSRQLKINQRLDLNAGQVLGAGTAGQPYFVKFGSCLKLRIHDQTL